MRPGLRIALAAAGAWLLWAAPGMRGEAGAAPAAPRSHRAVLDSLAGEVAVGLLRGVEFPAGRTVALEQPLPGDSLGALGQSLVEELRGRGIPVRLVPASGSGVTGSVDPRAAAGADDPGDLRLSVRVQTSSVSYVRAVRGFPWRVSGYDRLGVLGATAALLDGPSRSVVWARSASAERRDRVAKRDLAEVAAASGGMDPVPPRGSGFRFLEPLLVAGVTVGLVVLFYSTRN